MSDETISNSAKLLIQDKVRALELPYCPKERKTIDDICKANKHLGYAQAVEDILKIILTF